MASSVHNTDIHFPQDNHNSSRYGRSALCELVLPHKISQRHVSKGQDLSQLIIFTMSPRTLSKRGFPPFHGKCVIIGNTASTGTIHCHCPDFCCTTTLLLWYWFKISAQRKCQMTPYYRNSLDPREPLWSVDHTLRTSALVWAKKEGYGKSTEWTFDSLLTENLSLMGLTPVSPFWYLSMPGWP